MDEREIEETLSVSLLYAMAASDREVLAAITRHNAIARAAVAIVKTAARAALAGDDQEILYAAGSLVIREISEAAKEVARHKRG